MSEEDDASTSRKHVDNNKQKPSTRKICKNKDLKHVNTKNKEVCDKKEPGEVSCKCQFSCNCLTLECRKNIFHDFWNLDHNEQQNYLKKLIRICAVGRRRYGNYDDITESRRKRTTYYIIIKGQSEVQVCQKTFCNTFGVNQHRVQLLSRKIARNSEAVKEVPHKRWVW